MDSEYIYQKATALKVALPEGCETHLNYIAKTVTRMVDQTSDGEFTVYTAAVNSCIASIQQAKTLLFRLPAVGKWLPSCKRAVWLLSWKAH